MTAPIFLKIMVFTVTYRDSKSGGKKTLDLDVSSKADVWPISKDRGIVAISVVPRASEKRGTRPKLPFKCFLGFAIIFACFGVAIYLQSKRDGFASDQKSETENDKKSMASKNKITKPQYNQAATKTVKDADASITNKIVNDSRFPYADGRKVISSITNNWDQIIDICIMPDGKRRKVIRSLKPQTYNNISDNILAVALSGDMDGKLPPLPIVDNIEEEFVKSLKVPIKIFDDDSEEIKESKRRVIEAREIISEEMKKGRGFREILDEHLAMRESNAEAREIVMESVIDLKKNGDPESLNKYLEKANEYLRNIGAGEVNEFPIKKRKGE